MRRRSFTSLLPLAAALALAAGASATTKPQAIRYKVTASGFSIVLSSDWYPIPRTVAAIKKTIANYKAANNASVAGAYGDVLDSSLQRSELSKYVFQAFFWPPLKNLVPTEVSVQVVRDAGLTQSDLAEAAKEYATAIGGPESTVSAPQRLTLPAGPCELVEGTVNNGGGVETGAALYLFIHAGRLYVISFEIDGPLLHESSYSDQLREIASTFSYLKS